MIALIQRVSEAQVRVGGELVGAIHRGVLALIGVQRADTAETGARLPPPGLNRRHPSRTS